MKPLIVSLAMLLTSFNVLGFQCHIGKNFDLQKKYRTQLTQDLRKLVRSNNQNIGELIARAGCLSLLDPSGYSGELVYPIYKANKVEFSEGMNSLPPQQKERLEHFIKLQEK